MLVFASVLVLFFWHMFYYVMLDDRSAWARFPAGARELSLLQSIHTGCEAQPPSSTMVNEGCFAEGKKGCGVKLTALVLRLRMCGLYLHSPCSFLAWYLIKHEALCCLCIAVLFVALCLYRRGSMWPKSVWNRTSAMHSILYATSVGIQTATEC